MVFGLGTVVVRFGSIPKYRVRIIGKIIDAHHPDFIYNWIIVTFAEVIPHTLDTVRSFILKTGTNVFFRRFSRL